MTTPGVTHSLSLSLTHTHTHTHTGTLQKQPDDRAIWLHFLKGVPSPGVAQSQIQPLQCEWSQQSSLPRRSHRQPLCLSRCDACLLSGGRHALFSRKVQNGLAWAKDWPPHRCSVDYYFLFPFILFPREKGWLNLSCFRVVLFANSQCSRILKKVVFSFQRPLYSIKQVAWSRPYLDLEQGNCIKQIILTLNTHQSCCSVACRIVPHTVSLKKVHPNFAELCDGFGCGWGCIRKWQTPSGGVWCWDTCHPNWKFTWL